jgi:hypothetical protein
VGSYSYADELGDEHVSHDSHAQLMQITGAGNVDRYIGIYQTVDVVAGETYTLSLHGLIRSSTAEDPKVPYGHRIQYAIDYEGKGDWHQVEDWIDPGWNEVSLGQDYPPINAYVLPITAKSDKLTLFIRGWTKWPIQSVAKFYIDGVSLNGPIPGEEKVITVAAAGDGDATSMPTTGGSAIWLPVGGLVFVVGFALWEIRRKRALG